ncbi:serine kinase [Halalkalibacillus sediminis]|uniref:Serine kinase n=1 Tax=Halalkalibacillus sediminis TaxID=2018042 RepID=A0A2I0QR97_9BACI|nr:phosphotransferase [Halalkalibacillus sediminis]PKR76848.1 serine kinase [Halalkalibacillus sediminis]
MKASSILNHFYIKTDVEPESIYSFSPVYKINHNQRELILKTTQHPLDRAENLVDYTNYLHKKGVSVVTPVHIDAPNPQTIGEDTFVVYPFIQGTTYSGTLSEIYKAGKLLGQIHSLAPVENEYRLPVYDVYDFNSEEIKGSIANIKEYSDQERVPINIDLLEKKFLQAVENQEQLKNSKLPYVSTPHDFKANNLIYTPEPYLVDPDNATYIPRIFDLALALLLFHNELNTAPNRMFTIDEWKTFLKGYCESVVLTDLEKECWKAAVEHVFLDEVMWLMAEVEEDWKRDDQKSLFVSLIDFILSENIYTLIEE